MDVTIEAEPMTASAEIIEPVVTIEVVVVSVKAFSLQAGSTASIACPSLGSHSISAVAPDHILTKEYLAHAA
jgi:hypothetical protein